MRQRKPGFSIIELLMVIAIISVLLALSVPVISKVRAAGADIVSLANLRSHAQVFTMYSNDWNDWLPQVADPRADYSVARDESIQVAFRYFEAAVYWPVALSNGYYDGSVLGDSHFLHPGTEPERFNIYNYSSSLLADPAYWNRLTRESGNAQWGGCRIDQVTFPSSKAVLVEYHPFNPRPIATEAYTRLQPGCALALVDGSAARHHTKDLVPPYPFGDGEGVGTYQHIGVFGMHTPDGWRGRDVK
jgi:prepilin-type N-terminal cleavage/methylation domain-containing protein